MDMNHLGVGWLVGGTFGGLILGWVGKGWGYVRSGAWRVMRRFVTKVEICDEHTAKAVLFHLMQNYRRSSFHDRAYGSASEYMRSGKYGLVGYEYLDGKSLVFFKGWLPLMFTPAATPTSTNNGQPQQTFSSRTSQKFNLFFIRGTFDAEALVREAAHQRNLISWDNSEKNKVRRFFIKQVPDHKDKNGGGQRGVGTQYTAGVGLTWYQEPTYRLITHEVGDLGKSRGDGFSALELLVFPERVKQLIQEIIIWRRNRDWYMKRGIPWKRGWLLYGPAGTGKTALVRAFAEDLDLPLFAYSLGEMINEDLTRSWEEMQAHTPCVALFEDIDNVFHGRENVFSRGPMGMQLIAEALAPKGNEQKKEGESQGAYEHKFGRLSFDCLLNCLDGVDKADGVFVVITTNHVDKIDPAIGQPRKGPDGEMEFISTRPGRIDKAIELTYMEPDDKVELAERILYDCPEGLERIKQFIGDHPTLLETPAQFQERCAQMALAYFWKAESGGHPDASEQMSKRALSVVTNGHVS